LETLEVDLQVESNIKRSYLIDLPIDATKERQQKEKSKQKEKEQKEKEQKEKEQKEKEQKEE